MDNRMDEKDAELLRSRSRAAFDAQAPTYDTGMEGDHARRLYPHVLAEVARAVAGNPAPRLLDLGCGTGIPRRAGARGGPGRAPQLRGPVAEDGRGGPRAPGRAGRRPAL